MTWTPPAELPRLADCAGLVVDLETRDDGLAEGLGAGWPWGGGYVVGIAVGPLESRERWYFPIRHEAGGNLDPERVLRWARDELGRERRWGYLFHGSLYDHGWGRIEGLRFPGLTTDTAFAAALLDENQYSYSLDACAERAGIPGKDLRTLEAGAESIGVSAEKAREQLWRMHSSYVGPYAEGDIEATRALWAAQVPLIEQEGLGQVLRLECDLVPLLTEMRARGIRIDERAADELESHLVERFVGYQQQIRARWGVEVPSPRAAKGIAAACKQLGIPHPKTPKGNPSFTDDWLRTQSHPFLVTLREYREVQTLRTSILEQVTSHARDGRVYPELHPVKRDRGRGGTVSGRFSCSNPNAQQISGRTELGARARRILVPEPGERWAAVDISQQEPRLTVHYAVLCGLKGAKEAAEEFRRGGAEADWHAIAAGMMGAPLVEIAERVNAKTRQLAKPINLGLGYGMGEDKLKRELGVDEISAARILRLYHRRLPFMRQLYDLCDRRAQALGYVRTMLGRRCRFDLWEPTRRGRFQALPFDQAVRRWPRERLRRAFTYRAMNRVIQGSSADWIKLAMRELWREGIVPMLQVHDEFDLSVSEEGTVKRACEITAGVVELEVPAVVDYGIGTNWAEAK